MCVLIGNTVKTETGDYPCKTREEAEALYLQIREREKARKESRSRDPQRAPQPEEVKVG